MSPLLVALLGVLLIPLFVGTWRTSLLGLAGQGLLMALIAYRLALVPRAAGDWLALFDLGVVRGVVAPLALYTVLRARRTPARNDVIPPNLLSWTLALGMVLASFSFAALLVPEGGEQRTLVAVASTAVMLGFLVLATQASHFSQMVGVLRIENAIALLELGGAQHQAPLGPRLGLLVVFVATLGLLRWYLVTLGTAGGAARADAGEGRGR